jgi:hypothetical protein
MYCLGGDSSLFCNSEVVDIYDRYGAKFKVELSGVEVSRRNEYAVAEISVIRSRLVRFESVCLWDVGGSYGAFSKEYEDVSRFMSNVKLSLSLFKDLDDVGAAAVVRNYCSRVSRGLERVAVCKD